MSKVQRCRATRLLNTHQGLIKAQTTGTINFEIENLDRRLISVQWDGSFQCMCFQMKSNCWIQLSLTLEKAVSPDRQT
jgi:hypothetical protein